MALAAVVAVVGIGAVVWSSRSADPAGPLLPGAAGSTVDDCSGVRLSPDDDLGGALLAHPEGTLFCLRPGTYRVSDTLTPRSGQQLVGEGKREAVISGAQPVAASREGDRWVVTGQRSLGPSELGSSGQCRPVDGVDPQGMCVYKDQVFLDDVSLWQVGSLSELSTGEFFWDYGSNTIYLADDPTGRELEVSVVGSHGIDGQASDVVIQNLIVEKFGNNAQSGAIQAQEGWSILGSEIRLNHGGGVHMGPGTVVSGNFIHHNGQLGIHGGGPSCSGAKGLVVEDNEISYNNAAGYNWGWEAGASKWFNTDGLIVRNNHVHDNYGMGLWTDGANINVLYEGNLVENNHGMGINHELGYAAVIRDNVVRGNGFHHGIEGSAWGAGIFIDQSRDVEIYDNVVEGNAAGITAVQEPGGSRCGYGEAEVANLRVYDNEIHQEEGLAAGLQLLRESDRSYFTDKNNRWENNTYVLAEPDGAYFRWAGDDMTASEWRSQGHG